MGKILSIILQALPAGVNVNIALWCMNNDQFSGQANMPYFGLLPLRQLRQLPQ